MNYLPVINKTRIAPTPSGYLHLGNVLSFAITAAIAEKAAAHILLRIDDLDRERARREYLEDIFDTLHFLDIPWQEGPASADEFEQCYSQAHRLPLYEQSLQQLAAGGHVFACTCSRTSLLHQQPGTDCPCADKNIPLNTPSVNWRLHTRPDLPLSVKTLSGELIHATLPADMHHFIVRKKDGYPAYQLSSLVDDLHYGITHIVRGEDLWPSTLAQLYLAQVLQQEKFTDIVFHHHLLLTDTTGNKLSKSAGASSVQYLRKQGLNASAVYTQLSTMLGQTIPVHNWSSLAALVIGSQPGAAS